MRMWLPELAVLTILVSATFIIFSIKNWDIQAAGYFFHPENLRTPWPDEKLPFWRFFYHLAPILTIAIAAGALCTLAYSAITDRAKKLRIYALFIFLSAILGPGLVVNVVFKDHWGRPRPRQIQEFNGRQNYQEFWQKGLSGQGKSFPCGHSSIAFSLMVFWFIWKRRKKTLAYSSLLIAITLGTLMGIGRMAAGGHFLSDVIFSAFIPFLVSWLLYYFILNIPYREDHPHEVQESQGRFRIVTAAAYSVLILITIAGALLAHPVHQDLYLPITEKETRGLPLEAAVEIDDCHITVDSLVSQADIMMITGYIRGFGFPTHKIRTDSRLETTGNPAKATYKVTQSGFFTEKLCEMKIRIAREVQQLKIFHQKSNVTVIDPDLRNKVEILQN